MKKTWPLATTALCGLALLGATPALAGWDASNGANFTGTWKTRWKSETGVHNADLTLTPSAANANQLNGTYDKSTMTGMVTPYNVTLNDGTVVRRGWYYDGQWKRTPQRGRVTAPTLRTLTTCDHGGFHLLLIDPSPGEQAPDLTFAGKWSQCDAAADVDANDLLLTGDQPQNVALDGYILPVPLFSQLTNMWCWAASGQMVVKFLYPDIKIEQGQQANLSTGRTDCQNDPTPGPYPPDYKDPQCVVGGWSVLDKFGVTFTEKDEAYVSKTDPDDATKTVNYATGTGKEALSWDDLKAQINAGQPVMYAWAWREHPTVDGDRYASGGHMMVARGWETVDGINYVVINNPWVPQEGAEEIMTYDTWVGGLDQDHLHWADFYDFSGPPPKISKLPQTRFSVRLDQSLLKKMVARPVIGVPPEPDPLVIMNLQSVSHPEALRVETNTAVPRLRQLARGNGQLAILGLANTDEADRATLGQGIAEYTISPGSLTAYNAKTPVATLLGRPGAVLSPVIVDGRVRSGVRVQASGARPRVSSFGDAGLVTRIDRITPLSKGQSPSAIRIPALGLYFVTRQGADGLEIAPIFSTPQLGLTEGQFEPASAVFARLAAFAATVKGAAG